MGAKTEKRKIGEHHYSVTHLPAWDGFGLGQELLGMFGQAGAALIVGAVRSTKLSETDKGALAGAVLQEVADGTGLLARALANARFREIAQKMLETLRCDDKLLPTDVQQMHFADNLGELVGVIAFALEVNFRSFFSTGPVSALLQRARAAGALNLSSLLTGSTPGSPTSSGAGPS